MTKKTGLRTFMPRFDGCFDARTVAVKQPDAAETFQAIATQSFWRAANSQPVRTTMA